MTMHEAKLLHAFHAWAAQKIFDAVARVLPHLVDHGTRHRRQIVSLLRQRGATPPSTGTISREAAQRA